MKLLVSFLLGLIIFGDVASPVSAKLVINEFSSGSATDWVEIYNDGDSDMPLSMFILRDNSTSNKLELNGILAPKGFIAFEWSDRLNNSGDVIRIVKAEDESFEEDKVIYGNLEGKMLDGPTSAQYAARTTDGAGSWGIYTTDTKGSSNGNATPIPTATPEPTETPKPSATPTKTPTPTKSTNLTSTPSPTTTLLVPTSTKSPVLGAATQTQDLHIPTPVLAARKATAKVIPSPPKVNQQVKTLGVSTISPGVIFIGVGIFFLLSCVGYGYHSYKKGQL